MLDNLYLNGYIYHMVHIRNLASILQRRAFLSRDKVRAEGIKYYSIAEEEVQGLRDRVFIWDWPERRWRPLHSYVPFYFAKLTPMLYRRKEIQHDIVFLEAGRSLLKNSGTVFTDGNVTNQQLAKYRTEKVCIVPATVQKPLCRRKYSSGVPLGGNTSRSNVYADPVFLKDLRWDIIENSWEGDPEKRRVKHAEVLVPDIVPLSRVEGIATLTQEKANAVNMLIKRCGLEGRIPGAVSRPDLYF